MPGDRSLKSQNAGWLWGVAVLDSAILAALHLWQGPDWGSSFTEFIKLAGLRAAIMAASPVLVLLLYPAEFVVKTRVRESQTFADFPPAMWTRFQRTAGVLQRSAKLPFGSFRLRTLPTFGDEAKHANCPAGPP